MKTPWLHWDDIAVYLATMAGVFLAFYLPLFRLGNNAPLIVRPSHLIIGALLSLLVTFQDETSGHGVSPEAIRHGKRKNLRRRLAYAMSQGFMWPSLTAATIQ